MTTGLGIEYVDVIRRGEGPFEGAIIGDVLAYTFVWVDTKQEPPHTFCERVFVLLDVGAQIANPPLWAGRETTSRYVDLVTVTREGNTVAIRDLYIDAVVSTDGRGYRLLDLEEYGEALDSNAITQDEAIDGMKRWQLFLDRYLHDGEFPVSSWKNFPPVSFRAFDVLDNLTDPTTQASSGLR